MRARTLGPGGQGRAGGHGRARGARSAPGRAKKRRRSEPAPPCFHSRCGAAGRGGGGRRRRRDGGGGARAAGCRRRAGLFSSSFSPRGLRGCTGRSASAGCAQRSPRRAGSKRFERLARDLRSNSGRRQPAGAALPCRSLPPSLSLLGRPASARPRRGHAPACARAPLVPVHPRACPTGSCNRSESGLERVLHPSRCPSAQCTSPSPPLPAHPPQFRPANNPLPCEWELS